jgi:hypothetical protein
VLGLAILQIHLLQIAVLANEDKGFEYNQVGC